MQLTVKQISSKTGISDTTIRKRIKQHGIKRVGRQIIGKTRTTSGGIINHKAEIYDFEQVKAVLDV